MADELDDLRAASRDEVQDAIEDAFHTADALDETEITVVVEPKAGEMGPTIRLLGRVATESERQIAGEIVTDVLGLPDLDNRLAVVESGREDAPGFDKPIHDDTDYMGEALEALDGGLVDDEFGYIPPDHPIPETTDEPNKR